MTDSSSSLDPAAAARPEVEPTWGVSDAALGWVIAESMGVLASGILLSATGHVDRMGQAALDGINKVTGQHLVASFVPLWMIAVLQAFLWFGLLGAPIVATRLKGNGVVRDLGLRFEWVDVPIGVAVGMLCQFILVPLLSYPWVWILGRHTGDLDQPARDLADKATDPIGIILLVLIVVIGAPIVEELFFRGLLQRSIARRSSTAVAVAGSAAVFGLTHFELLQLPALVGFGVVLGLLAVRTGRLGPSIFAHLSFNAVTVIALLAKT